MTDIRYNVDGQTVTMPAEGSMHFFGNGALLFMNGDHLIRAFAAGTWSNMERTEDEPLATTAPALRIGDRVRVKRSAHIPHGGEVGILESPAYSDSTVRTFRWTKLR